MILNVVSLLAAMAYQELRWMREMDEQTEHLLNNTLVARIQRKAEVPWMRKYKHTY